MPTRCAISAPAESRQVFSSWWLQPWGLRTAWHRSARARRSRPILVPSCSGCSASAWSCTLQFGGGRRPLIPCSYRWRCSSTVSVMSSSPVSTEDLRLCSRPGPPSVSVGSLQRFWSCRGHGSWSRTAISSAWLASACSCSRWFPGLAVRSTGLGSGPVLGRSTSSRASSPNWRSLRSSLRTWSIRESYFELDSSCAISPRSESAWAGSLGVMVFERDLGSSLLFFTLFVVVLWVARERWVVLAVGAVLFVGGAFAAWHDVRSRADERVDIWLDPFKDPKGDGFQIVEARSRSPTVASPAPASGKANQVASPSLKLISSSLRSERNSASPAPRRC
jgi:hypothetical protein